MVSSPSTSWQIDGETMEIVTKFIFLGSKITVMVTAVKVKVAQSCPALCNPVDCSLPGSSLHGIPQARILEWVAISFRGSSQPRDRTWVSRIPGRRFNLWATMEALFHLYQGGKQNLYFFLIFGFGFGLLVLYSWLPSWSLGSLEVEFLFILTGPYSGFDLWDF